MTLPRLRAAMAAALPAAALLVGLAGAAFADPVLHRVDHEIVKRRRLDIAVDATFETRGEIAVTGTVNGVALRRPVRKRMRPGDRSVTLRVDSKRLRLRHLETPLTFDLRLTAREAGSSEEPWRDIRADVPVPLFVLPGLGHERAPGSLTAFPAALDLMVLGAYGTAGPDPAIVVHEYPSLTATLPELAADLDKAVRSTLRGTAFAKVDVVGVSYGGIVARAWTQRGGAARARRVVFVGTPNEGTPVAYAGVGLADSGQLDAVLGTEGAQEIATLLLDEDTRSAMRNVYPTYEWAKMRSFITGQIVPVETVLLEAVLGDSSTPLEAMNREAPPTGVGYFAIYHTSVPGGTGGTVDVVDFSLFLGGSAIDPAALLTGAGDGLVPSHSTYMGETDDWRDVVQRRPVGEGVHGTMPLDPRVLAEIADIVRGDL